MFYDPRSDPHGLPYNPFKACVVPRPIGWITTLSHDGVVNLAPYSLSNQLAYDPPFVFFSGSGVPVSDGGEPRAKDSVLNAQNTGEFVYNMATFELREAVNLSSDSFPPEVDEMEVCQLAKAPCMIVKPPRIADSPISLECRHHTTVTLPSRTADSVHHIVIGAVVGIHIRDDVLREGKVDWQLIKPLARLGYRDYTVVERVFSMAPPRAFRSWQ